MLVQTLHPVGHPAGAGFEKGNFQFRIKLENTAADDAHDADHLFEGVRGRVHKKALSKRSAAAAGLPEPTWTHTGTPSSSALA